jgi:hypothetical protein
MIERFGWWAMSLVVFAALVGGLGQGPLSIRDVGSPDGTLLARFRWVVRSNSPSSLALWIRPAHDETYVDLTISKALSDKSHTERIVPRPESISGEDGDVVFRFRTDALAPDGKVLYSIKHDKVAVLEYQVGLRGKQPVSIRQWVLP